MLVNLDRIENAKSIDYLVEIAKDRDQRAEDNIRSLVRSDFCVNDDYSVTWRNYHLLPEALDDLANLCNFHNTNFTNIHPDEMNLVLTRNLPNGEMMFRLFQDPTRDNNYVCRSILSTKYKPKNIEDSVRYLLESVSHPDRLKVVHTHSDATSFGAEVIDLDGEFDLNKVKGNNGINNLSKEDRTFAGWKLVGNDIGTSAQKIFSNLWRLVCGNGSCVADRQTSARAIHKGQADFFGSVLDKDQWIKLISQACQERMKFINVKEASKKFAKMNNRPNLDIFESAWNGLFNFTQPQTLSPEVPIYSENDSLLDQVIAETNWRTFRRIDLAQAFGLAANGNKLSYHERNVAQNFSGRLITNSFSEVLPTLESLIVS